MTNDRVQPSSNPIDAPEFFAREQYLDFLNRQPDAPGLAFWTNQIAACGNDAACIENKRINVSAAFFLSIEFQQTGYFVYRLHQAAFGLRPTFREFMRYAQEVGSGVVVGSSGWEAKLEANKRALVHSLSDSIRFRQLYDGLTGSQFVDRLTTNAGLRFTAAERKALSDRLASGAETRSSLLRRVAENEAFIRQEFNPAFVTMQYFGYLRREPDSRGFDFWLNKLNSFGGDFVKAEMVKAFITSRE